MRRSFALLIDLPAPLLLLLALAACFPASRSARAQAALDRQLLVNPGAEAGPIIPGGAQVVPIPGWETGGSNFTVDTYGPNGDVSDAEGQRIGGGIAFFSGGPNNAASSAIQRVDVSALAGPIDAGGVSAIMSAQLTGYKREDDNGTITVTFRGTNGQPLGSGLKLGPQPGNFSDWQYYRAIGPVPPGTRTVEVAMIAHRLLGVYDDAYFDNLSLFLTQSLPHPPQAVNPPPQSLRSDELLTNGGAESGMGSDTGMDVLPIPGWTTAGSFTVFNYGAPGSPPALAAAVQGWGKRVFAGGPSAQDASAYQDVDLSAYAADIDAGKLALHFSVVLGAAGTGNTSARATVVERDANGDALTTLDTGPVLSAVAARVREAPLVPGARSAHATLYASPGDAAANNAFFDNVSLKLIDTVSLPAPIPPASGPAPLSYGANLLKDPGAEDANPDYSNYPLVVPISSWQTTGNFSAVDYSVPDFLIAAAGERIGGGRSFFAGGAASPFATAAQTVDVSSFGPDVNQGGISAHLEAQMGGFAEQGDSATVVATFLDGQLMPLGTILLPPVTGSDPAGGAFTFQQADGMVPPGTRSIQVMLVAQRLEGDYNDAYFDNIWLSLDRKALPTGLPGDLNGDGGITPADAVLLLKATLGLTTLTPDQQALADLNGDGQVTVADVALLLRQAVGLPGPA